MTHKNATEGDSVGPATREVALKLGEVVEFLRLKHMPTSKEHGRRTKFYHPAKPTITVDNYVTRLVDDLSVSFESFVVAALFVARLECYVTDLTAHRLVLAAVVVAAKVQDDHIESLSELSRVGGVDVDELVVLEAELLRLLDFRVCVDLGEYTNTLFLLEVTSQFFSLLDPVSTQPTCDATSKPIPNPNCHHRHNTTTTTAPQTSPTAPQLRRRSSSSFTTATSISSTSPASTTSTNSDSLSRSPVNPFQSPASNKTFHDGDDNNRNSPPRQPSVFAMRRSKGLAAAAGVGEPQPLPDLAALWPQPASCYC